jgi:hypothetical protein
MLKYCSIIKNNRQFVLLLVIFLFACNGKENQQFNKKISDTIPVKRKVEPVKNNNKKLPVQITENATENRLVGETFIAELRHSCVMTSNGGFDIYIFLVLSFDQHRVTVTKQRVDTETHIIDKKTYSWKVVGNAVIIDHLDDYGKLQIKTDRLISTQYDGSTVEFINKKVDYFNKRNNHRIIKK